MPVTAGILFLCHKRHSVLDCIDLRTHSICPRMCRLHSQALEEKPQLVCVCVCVHYVCTCVFVHCVCVCMYMHVCVLAHRCPEDRGLLLAQGPVLREVPLHWFVPLAGPSPSAWSRLRPGCPPTEGAALPLWPRPERLRPSVPLQMACLPASSPVFPPVGEFALWRTFLKCAMREELDKEYQWGGVRLPYGEKQERFFKGTVALL